MQPLSSPVDEPALASIMTRDHTKGFCQIEKIKKIREKLGSGWVGQAPTRIIIFFGNVVFFVLFSCFQMFQKKKIGWGGRWLGSD